MFYYYYVLFFILVVRLLLAALLNFQWQLYPIYMYAFFALLLSYSSRRYSFQLLYMGLSIVILVF